MVSDDGRYVIVYNGEIYNYLELREELLSYGCRFHSHTDTEVILEAYRIWGKDCVERFNGMWAIAIYDSIEQKIFLSRDRFGVKPLYYTNRKDCFVFSSEIKGILAAFPDARQVNLPMLHYFLPSGALDEGPETFFVDIFSLLPAHSAFYSVHTGELRTWRFWDLDQELFRVKWAGEDPVDTLWQLLHSAVQLRLRSDVPVGTCLSGGTDSSTIVALMSRMRSEPVHTFSGLYSDKDCDERIYVDLVNRSTGAIASAVSPDPKAELLEVLSKITWHQDEPTAGPGLYTQYYVMRSACADVKVILDGQGGDELLAGYLPYLAIRIKDLWDGGGSLDRLKAVHLMVEVVRHWGPRWLEGAADRVLGRTLSRLIRDGIAWHQTKGKGLPHEPPFFHPSLIERCRGREIVRERPKRLQTELGNTLYWHLVEQSIPALLHYEDRNSMAFSIEARVPFLDYRIVEFALALGDQYKIKGSWTKWVLRQCADRILPSEVAWRRSKLGYPTPFSRWLRCPPDREDFRQLLFSTSFLNRELVTRDSLKYYWEQHQSGQVDRSWLLYRYATVELWYRQYIDQWRPNPARAPQRVSA
jgi:asparagine synthase (glutamine-hydrolysing)